jgi:acetyltransferase-like isoleucine patch superfamily enzyme
MQENVRLKRIHIHPTAEVSENANIGEGTSIWNACQVRERAVIGKNCILSKGVYIDVEVVIGDNCKIQNNASIYHGVVIGRGVFIGPHVCFTNDLNPRAINIDGSLKQGTDWNLSQTYVDDGASIGANTTIRCGIKIGQWSMIGAGSVVTKDVPPFTMVFGNPATHHGYVCYCGEKLSKTHQTVKMTCPKCGSILDL